MHVSVEVRGSIQTLFNSSIENNSCVQVLVPQRVAFKSNKGSSAKTPNKRTEFCDFFAVDGVLYVSETVLWSFMYQTDAQVSVGSRIIELKAMDPDGTSIVDNQNYLWMKWRPHVPPIYGDKTKVH